MSGHSARQERQQRQPIPSSPPSPGSAHRDPARCQTLARALADANREFRGLLGEVNGLVRAAATTAPGSPARAGYARRLEARWCEAANLRGEMNSWPVALALGCPACAASLHTLEAQGVWPIPDLPSLDLLRRALAGGELGERVPTPPKTTTTSAWLRALAGGEARPSADEQRDEQRDEPSARGDSHRTEPSAGR